MSKRSSRHGHQPPAPDAEHHGDDEHAAHESGADERARQQAMAARSKATRTQLPAGQANTMRLKRRNQPRGN